VADLARGTGGVPQTGAPGAAPGADRPLTTVQVYRVLIGAQLRSQLSYRSSFVLNAVVSFLVGWLEFLEIYVLLHNAPVLGGLTFAEASLVFAFANLGFSLADLVCGQLDSLPTFIRRGTLETYLVRPMPLAAQMITSTVQLRRLGRTLVGVAVLIFALTSLDLDLTPGTVYLLVITPLVAAAIYASFFLTAGGLQFFLIDGTEFTNAFVYGGNYASQLPGSVLITPLRVFFTFVVPALFTAYLPTLVILDRPGPPFAPAWLGWWTPVAALLAWAVALFLWRTGIHKYTGAGG
jgi:ABC-2 type transport system permease protein